MEKIVKFKRKLELSMMFEYILYIERDLNLLKHLSGTVIKLPSSLRYGYKKETNVFD